MADNRQDMSLMQIESLRQENKINWSHIAISALATLIVTVLAGILIFYLTNKPVPAPKLFFEKVPPTSFSTDKVKTVIQSFRVWNEGNKEAENIQISITLPKNAIVADQKIEPSGGATINFQVSNVDSNTLLVKIPSLNPTESVSFAFLLDNTTEQTLEIDVRAKGVVGLPSSTIPPSTSNNDKLRDPLFLFATILLVSIQFYLMFFIIRRRGIRSLFAAFSSSTSSSSGEFNNLGFRLLHFGQIAEARKYIQLAIEKYPDVYPLGNLAHIYALEGKLSEAITLCETAKEYASSSSSRAFVEYCLFCIYLVADKKTEAIPHLKDALAIDKKTIIEYYTRNVNIAKWKEDKDILSAFLTAK